MREPGAQISAVPRREVQQQHHEPVPDSVTHLNVKFFIKGVSAIGNRQVPGDLAQSPIETPNATRNRQLPASSVP